MTASGGDRRFGGGHCPFSKYEEGVYTAPDQGVVGFFIPCQRTRPRLEGEDETEEAPAILAQKFSQGS